MPPKHKVAAGADTGKLTVLVLQGGGALGAYECGALRYLYEAEDLQPDIIAGVSIGAITAAALAAPRNDDPIATVEELWRRLSLRLPFGATPFDQYLSLFGNPAFYGLRWDYFPFQPWTYLYDVTPLSSTLKDLVAFSRLAPGHRPRLVVTATNVATGEPVPFDSGEHAIEPRHILASGALPPGFPWVEIGRESYWDGGLFSNTPLSPVFEAARKEKKEIGTLVVIDLWPERGRLPGTMIEVFERIMAIIFRNKMTDDIKQAKIINAYLDALDSLPDEKSRERHDLARVLPAKDSSKPKKKFLRVDRFIHITPDEKREAEDITGAFDFSTARIELRQKHGYEDAKRAAQGSPAEEAAPQRKSRDVGMIA